MYHIFLIYLSTDGHMGCFCVLVILNKVAMYMGVRIFETLSSILLCLYPELKLLDHMVIIFLNFFCGNSILFSRVAVLLFIPANMCTKVLVFLHFPSAYYFLFLLIVVVVVLVSQSCLTLCDPTDCSPPGSSVCGILQARILEWVAIPFSRGSFWCRDRIQVSCIAGRFFTMWATGRSS